MSLVKIVLITSFLIKFNTITYLLIFCNLPLYSNNFYNQIDGLWNPRKTGYTVQCYKLINI